MKGCAQFILPVTQLAVSACNAPLIMWGQGRRHATRGVFVIHEACMSRKPWDLHFLAEPEEVAGLRRVLRIHLGLWGLDELIDAAQLCVSELVSNVITHVGPGTPTTLAVSMKDTAFGSRSTTPTPALSPRSSTRASTLNPGAGWSSSPASLTVGACSFSPIAR